MGSTQLRGPQRAGSTVLDEIQTRAVVASYAGNTKQEARDEGQTAASAILPLRRELWRLAERLVPLRLAAALRARLSTADPTGREGVRELRAAIADWLDPPPRCRRCGGPVRPPGSPQAIDPATGEARTCPAIGPDGDARLRRFEADYRRALARSREAWGGEARDLPTFATAATGAEAEAPASVHHQRRPSRLTNEPRPCVAVSRGPAVGAAGARLAAIDRCGTLALWPVGLVSLDALAAATACPRGAASGYDVAADRDCRALLAATRPPGPAWDRLGSPEYEWAHESAGVLYHAVRTVAGPNGRRGLGASGEMPRPLLAARDALQRARDRNLRTNGRLGLGVQARYYSPDAGVMRADLVQGGAIGVDRAGLDFDAARGFRFSTYGAEWARQGCGEAFHSRDLVDTPPWVLDLRREVEARLRSVGHDVARVLLRTVEALADVPAPAAARALAMLVARAEITVPSTGRGRPTTRRGIHVGHGGSPRWALARAALAVADPAPTRTRPGKRGRTRPAGASAANSAAAAPPNPERARERIAGWVAVVGLGLPKVSGSGLLTALRHGCPVFVPVDAGGQDDHADGVGGVGERPAVVIAAEDPQEAAQDEREAAERWGRALSALTALRATDDVDGAGPSDLHGAEAAEVVRRHHALDGAREDARGGGTGGGESFQAIADAGLLCSGRRPCKEVVRKIYLRAIDVLRRMLAGEAEGGVDADDLLEWSESDVAMPSRRPAWSSPWRPLRPATVIAMTSTAAPTIPPDGIDNAAWSAGREAADAVRW